MTPFLIRPREKVCYPGIDGGGSPPGMFRYSMPREAAGRGSLPRYNMTPDPAAIEEPWLLLDAAASDISDSGNRLECWSHVGGYADVYLCASPADPRPLTKITGPTNVPRPKAASRAAKLSSSPPAWSRPICWTASPRARRSCWRRAARRVRRQRLRRLDPHRGRSAVAPPLVRCSLCARLHARPGPVPRRAPLPSDRRTPRHGRGRVRSAPRRHPSRRTRPARRELSNPPRRRCATPEEICDLAARVPDFLEPVLSRFERAAPSRSSTRRRRRNPGSRQSAQRRRRSRRGRPRRADQPTPAAPRPRRLPAALRKRPVRSRAVEPPAPHEAAV